MLITVSLFVPPFCLYKKLGETLGMHQYHVNGSLKHFFFYQKKPPFKDPKLVENAFYKYDINNSLNLTKHINGDIKVKPTFRHSVYEKKNRLIRKYYCAEKKLDANRI